MPASRKLTVASSGSLLLKGEIGRHKALGPAYEAPEGTFRLRAALLTPQRDPWPYINAIRDGADRVLNAASGCGMSITRNANDLYENGKETFPSLGDRMHLAAVVAHCGGIAEAICTKALRTGRSSCENI